MNILISYFDPFGGKPTNNSEVIAKLIADTIDTSKVTITLCQIPTVYDKGFEVLSDCIHGLDKPADAVISLGEAGCKKLKIETRGINRDKSYGPDNDGIERNNTTIIPNGPKSIGVTLPVDKAYCALSTEQKKYAFISNSAGSFVCNNTTYHALDKLDLPYTFFHVPAASCTNEKRNNAIADVAVKLIESLPTFNLLDTSIPATIGEVKDRLTGEITTCEESFYKILKSEY